MRCSQLPKKEPVYISNLIVADESTRSTGSSRDELIRYINDVKSAVIFTLASGNCG